MSKRSQLQRIFLPPDLFDCIAYTSWNEFCANLSFAFCICLRNRIFLFIGRSCSCSCMNHSLTLVCKNLTKHSLSEISLYRYLSYGRPHPVYFTRRPFVRFPDCSSTSKKVFVTLVFSPVLLLQSLSCAFPYDEDSFDRTFGKLPRIISHRNHLFSCRYYIPLCKKCKHFPKI